MEALYAIFIAICVLGVVLGLIAGSTFSWLNRKDHPLFAILYFLVLGGSIVIFIGLIASGSTGNPNPAPSTPPCAAPANCNPLNTGPNP